MDEQNRLDYLMAGWKIAYDELEKATASLKDEVQELTAKLHETQQPHVKHITAIEDRIRPLALAHAATFKGDGVEVRYRKGACRVTYNWRVVDSVLGVLQDILPKTAKTLEEARSSSAGKPSVKVVRVKP